MQGNDSKLKPILIPDDPSGSGDFGRWTVDSDGLPAYDYRGDPAGTRRTASPPSKDHWHLVGNDRIIATAHADGHMIPFLTDRGKLWLSAVSPANHSWGGGFGWLRDGDQLLGSNRWSTRASGSGLERRFGVGYYEKVLHVDGIEVRHRVAAPFGDDPVLRVTIELINRSARPRELEWIEQWGVRLEPVRLRLLATGWTPPPRDRTAAERIFWRVANAVSATSRGLGRASAYIDAALYRYVATDHRDVQAAMVVPHRVGPKPGPTERAPIDYYPRPLFLAALSSSAAVTCRSAPIWFGAGGLSSPDGLAQPELGVAAPGGRIADPCLLGRIRVTLQPGERAVATFLYGMADCDEIPVLVARSREDRSNSEWRSALPYVQTPEHPWLTREVAWHGAVLRSHLSWEQYFENHICDQGGAYAYLQGMNSVPRDMSLVAAPLSYLAPERAREILLYMLRMVRPDGTMYYATHGRGMTTFAGLHARPSDLWPMVFWALSEYIGATRDLALLVQDVPFYPIEAGRTTVLERLKLGLQFLIQRIGRGPHGLLRVGSGDWSDGIQLMVRSRRQFMSDGESTYTTALADVACRRLATVVRDADPHFARDLQSLADELGIAWRAQWNGRWYRRAWDGAGNPVGDDHMFLEHHVWCLIAGVPEKHLAPLLTAIEEQLQRGSPLGARVLMPPTRTSFGILTPGWDVNGGIWASVNGLFTWALTRVDRRRALEELCANSMHQHANVVPHCWYGIWSGPDAYNAPGSEREGETFVHLATPMTDFPVMNMNRHSSTLLASLRLLGVDADGDRLTLSPRPSGVSARSGLRLPLCGYERENGVVKGYYRFFYTGTQRIAVTLETSDARGVSVTVDGHTVEAERSGDDVIVTLAGEAGEVRHFSIS